MLGTGTVAELILMDGRPAARIVCEFGFIPAAGQYLLAHQVGSDVPLAQALFLSAIRPDGFIAAPPVPPEWQPGVRLALRGPLGHGFSLPDGASRVALVAWDDAPRRLLPLVTDLLRHDVATSLVCSETPDDLPAHIEVQPNSALLETLSWADYAAIDVARESLPALGQRLRFGELRRTIPGTQVLVRVPMPCGALAECGICSVKMRRGTALACDVGPVFDLDLLDLEGQ